MSTWIELQTERDHPTLAILHLAAQMLGKVRVAHAPWTNHGWHVALQPRATGFETLPTAASDGRTFTLTLDLCAHAILLTVSDDRRDSVSLRQPTIAGLHDAFVAMLSKHGLPSDFSPMPNEIEGAVPFPEDTAPRAYDPLSADRLRRIFAHILPLFEHFRAGFAGKSSPVHLWWGAFDLAVSRFSGKIAPPHPGGMAGLPARVSREAYSHEVSSAGFWATGAANAQPFFYSYIYPEPDGYRESQVVHGYFDETYGEFVLPYADVRNSADPERTVREFLQSAYEAAATTAGWDRAAMEREPVAP